MIRKCMGCLLAVAVAAVVFAFPPPTQAGDEKRASKHGEQFFKGDISAVDFKAGTVTVKQKDGNMTFTCNAGTKYYAKQKKEGTKLDDFKVGDKVEVNYAVENGTPTCHRLAEEGSHPEHKEKQEAKSK